MRVFVTGATGWIGSAVVQELLAEGHHVLGLARSDTKATALAATGADVHRGSLEDMDSLRESAAAADGVIHTAFNHDHDWSMASIMASIETNRKAVEAMAKALEGSTMPFLFASGTMMLAGLGRFGRETDAPSDPSSVGAAETFLPGLPGIRAVGVRLAVTVHGAASTVSFAG
jgi:nucleoside-diphosphate-sugar epimerase